MRITRIELNGFGALRDQSVTFDRQVTLIHGENEAGKSTLTSFIRSVLFGFAPRGQIGERYEPAGGGAYGGSLTIVDDQGREVLVERHESSGRAKSSAGIVKVTFPDGSIGGEEALRELLGGISADVFRSLFAFGLNELQELRTLHKDEVGGYLYTAGLGVSPSAMTFAERRLTSGMERLFKARGKNPEINLAMKKLDELEQAIRREKEQVARYEGWRAEYNQAGEQIDAIEASRSDLQKEADWLNLCLKARSTWLRLRAVESELAELPEWEAFPEDAVARWESLLGEQERLSEEWTKLRLKLEELDERIAALQPDEELLNSKADIEWLLSSIPSYQADIRSEAEIGAELEQGGKELHRVLRLIDPGWTEETLERFPISAAVREQLGQHKSRLQDTERERDRTAARAAELAEQIASADLALKALSERMQTEAVDRRDDAVYDILMQAGYEPAAYLRELENKFGLVQRLEQERDYAAQRIKDEHLREELAQQLAAVRGRETANRRLLVLLGAAAVSAAAGAWQLAEGRFGIAAAAALAAAVSAAAGVILARKARPHASVADLSRKTRRYASSGSFTAENAAAEAEESMEGARGKLAQLDRQLAQAAAALEAHAQPLLAYAATAAAAATRTMAEPSAPDGERIVRSGRITAELDNRHEDYHGDGSEVRRLLNTYLAAWSGGYPDWQRRRDHFDRIADQADSIRQERNRLQEQAAATAERLLELGAAHAAACSAWEAWLERHAFSLTLSPSALQESLPLIEQGHALLHGQRRLAARRAAAEEAAATFTAAAVRLLGEAAAGDPALGVQRRGEALAHALRMREDAARAADERRDAARAAEALRSRLDALQLRQAELLAGAGADSDAGLRANARLHVRRVELIGERRHLLPSLAALVTDRRLPELDAALEARSETELAARASELEERLAALTREANELRGLRGRLAGETAKLERGEALADMLQRREEQLAALRKLGRDYAVRAFAVNLLRRAREVYERERQPGVLQRASDYFARMTRGRYTGVRAPIAAERRLEAVRPNGQGVDTALLSRGTAEQMYLAMRFALAEEVAPRAALPLIMDDILVNFDEERMRSCLDVLRELGEQRQIILFTCHRHVKAAAMERIPDMQFVELTSVSTH